MDGGRSNQSPCHCPLCNGRLRDKRTIRNHYRSAHSANSPSLDKQVSSSSQDNLTETVYARGYFEEGPSEGFLLAANGPDEITEENLEEYSNSDSEDSHTSNDSDSDVGDSYGSEIDSDDGSDDPGEDNVSTCEYTGKDIKNAVLRSIESKILSGRSQAETLSELRNLYELLKDHRIPHKSWNSVLSYLKKLGYKESYYFKVCCSPDHTRLLENETDCTVCGKSFDDCLNYYVLGIQLQNYFLNDTVIKDHLEHWEHKDEWLNIDDDDDGIKYKETWHGQHFRKLSYFWDKNVESLLPALCPNCNSVVSVREITAHVPPGNTRHNELYLSCRECCFDFLHKPKTMRGCELNQAFVFHEDGFNVFDKKSRGISAIHIASACLAKDQRTSGKYLRVYSFVPTEFIAEGIQHKMDPFLKPLVDEVKELYINGITVSIKNDIVLRNGNVIQPGKYQIRMLLLVGTADIKGHQEMLLYAGGGKFGCRICSVQGTYIPAKRHYYYGNFGVRYRNPCIQKSPEYYLAHGEEVENARTQTERKRLQLECGVSGISILFELYYLYEFNPAHDLVVDRMHLTFNMLKREFIDKIWADVNNNAQTDVNARDPDVGGLIDHNDFGIALNHVSWPKEEREKGVAKLRSLTDKLGTWKSNEFKRFSEIAKEVLAEKIPSKAYDCYMVLSQAVKMLYSKELKVFGWSEENIKCLNNLLWAHAIMCEDYYGLGYCTENLEYSTHAAAQIQRHSSLDNYSCELYERVIRRHKQQKHNSRGIEKTYVSRESLRDFLNLYKLKHGEISTYQKKLKYQFKMEILQQRQPFFLKESSLESASNLIEDFKACQDMRMEHAIKNGVLLGSISEKNLPDPVLADIGRYVRACTGLNDVEVQPILKTSKSAVVLNQFGEVMKLSLNDTVKVKSPNNTEEWIVEIDVIAVAGPFDGLFYSFLNGPYYIPVLENGQVAVHRWTGTPKYIQRSYQRQSVQPITAFCRKVMMYPEPGNYDNPNYCLCIDFKKPDLTNNVKVPIYPVIDETIKVKGIRNQFWYGKVTEVNLPERKVKVHWYQETRRRNVWTLCTNNEDEIHFRCVVGLALTQRVFGGTGITDI